MTSPSISSTRRSTPCAAGCCGPKFTVKLSISGIARILELGLVAVIVANDLRHERARLDADRLVDDAALVRVVAHLDLADHREILAERMPDEAVVRKEAPQVRVTAEQDSIEVERLALVPVCGAPYAGDGVDERLGVLRTESAQPQAPVVRDRHQLIDHGKASLRPIERRVIVVLLERHVVVSAEDAAAEARARRALRLPFV